MLLDIDWLIEHGFTSAPTQYRLYHRMTPQQIFTDIKDIRGSLLLHIWQLQSGMLNLNVEDHHVQTRTTVDDHQLLSTNNYWKDTDTGKQTSHEWSTTVSWFYWCICRHLYWQCIFELREFADKKDCTTGATHCRQAFRSGWVTVYNHVNHLGL